MKTIQKHLILAGLLLGLSGSGVVSAQEEQALASITTTPQNDVGLRLGVYTGIAFRHFGKKNNGVELSLLGWLPGDGAIGSALFEHRVLLPSNFSLYFGGGGFIGNVYASDIYYYRYGERDYLVNAGNPVYGLEGVFGADYTIPKVPLSFGVDFRPRFFNFYYPYSWDLGFNIRYHF
jgi:hypothetical protein